MSRKTVGGGTLDEERDARLARILDAARETPLGSQLPNTGLLRHDGGSAHEVTIPATVFIALCKDRDLNGGELQRAIEFELAQQVRVPAEL